MNFKMLSVILNKFIPDTLVFFNYSIDSRSLKSLFDESLCHHPVDPEICIFLEIFNFYYCLTDYVVFHKNACDDLLVSEGKHSNNEVSHSEIENIKIRVLLA